MCSSASHESASHHRDAIEVAVVRLPEQLDRADARHVESALAQALHELRWHLADERDSRLVLEAGIDRTTDEVGDAALEDLLFLDIETTGLGGAGAMAFLVAIARVEVDAAQK